MTKRTPKRRPRMRKQRAPAPPTLVTPEGDPLVFVRARYTLPAGGEDRQAAMAEIAGQLAQAADFGPGNEVESPSGEDAVQFPWYETEPGAKPPPDPIDRRVLAMITLEAGELEVETMSLQRMARCRKRLDDLLGARIQFVETTFKTVAEVLAEPPPEEAPEPLVLPPEAVAELEERLLRQWLDESIPALDGMTPREAARTPEGRQMLEDLFAYIERQQASFPRPPGMMSPDYRKAKKMLGLE